jgi:hypothetical protein
MYLYCLQAASGHTQCSAKVVPVTGMPTVASHTYRNKPMHVCHVLQVFISVGVWYMYAPNNPAPKKKAAAAAKPAAAAAANKDEGAAAAAAGEGEEGTDVAESSGSKSAATRATRRRA